MKTSAEGKKFECLLVAARQIVADFNTYGEVLQMGDNGEYGVESAIGQLAMAVDEIDNPPKRCDHSFIAADNEGFYGFEVCRFCGKRRHK